MAALPSPENSARAVALELLATVLRQKCPLDDALAGQQAMAGLETRDRGFSRNLVATTLRRLGQIDALIGHALERPLPAKAWGVMDILRLGACQLLFLDTPPHAAVDTMVDLAQAYGMGPHKKLVNAVLRRFAREGKALIEAQDAARLNTPDWLWQSWAQAYGEDTCRAIAEAHLAEAPLDITVKTEAAKWAEKLGAEILPTGTLRRPSGGLIHELPGFADGAWWVQDAAAALPVQLLGDVKGRRVIDLCAAPGGKTAQLAVQGAIVTAVDRSEKRLKRLRENLGRLGLEAELVTADATTWHPAEMADAVLVDAPCSSTGTIRRHPDVAHLKTPEDVAKLAVLQKTLLAAAFSMVRPGGLVVYCSCSLQPEEGPGHIKALLQSDPSITHAPLRPDDVGGMADLISDAGDLRTLPGHLAPLGGMDGFFAARLKSGLKRAP
ncbi:MAG: 16S rRNA (cytosine(967)-C(5))-methyltransferase RsmB [Rhodospirillales bacterium]|nr:16S rRNA (cytosine(967)-C(5))-methyltransferase RsmB [Rhodospirillales bacterium]